MKKIFAICMTAIICFTFAAGCGGSIFGIPLTGGTPATPGIDINAPDRAPSLTVSISQNHFPEQSVRALQLSTSWTVANEDGSFTSYNSDSPHALQLRVSDFNAATLRLSGSSGIIELLFSDDFPPLSITAQRWDAKYATGSQDIEEALETVEYVDVRDSAVRVDSDGTDYIYKISASWENNGNSWYTFRLNTENSIERVDIGCCDTDIEVRETALIGANTATHENNDFIMTLNSDKRMYSTNELITIWGTLEYTGDDDEIEIWSGCPLMSFQIAGGNEHDFSASMGGLTVDILISSVLERGKVYHFDFQKSGGWNESDEDVEFWENFFSEEDLFLPEGEYTITLIGGFGLTERVSDNPSDLRTEINIVVIK